MNPKQNLLIGAHMSISGGLQNALLSGESIGCTAVQFFSHSNRQWHMKPLTADEIALFKKTAEHSSVQSALIHASYLLNLGSPDKETRTKSVGALKEEVKRAEQLGVPAVILHPGSFITGSTEESLEFIAYELDQVFDSVPGKTQILLENTAGQGSALGYTFEQLAVIHGNAQHKSRIGFCFDTCHAFVAGYSFASEKEYEQMWEQFDKIIGLEYLKAMHINDSKKGCGSRVDRHEGIGKGQMGIEPFKLIFNDSRFFDIPKVLETPKGDGLDEDIENLTILKQLLTEKTKSLLNIP